MQLDIKQIKELIPHRYPFLMIDKITDMEAGKWATGIKCVSGNEPQFEGHFPEYPVMPGVLVLEALAQTGAVALLSEEKNKGKRPDLKIRHSSVSGCMLDHPAQVSNLSHTMSLSPAIQKVADRKSVV